MSQISQKAADLMQAYVQKHGFEDDKALLDYAFALSQRYGQAIGSLSCKMYEATAAAQGVVVPTAEIADLPEYGEVAKAVHGTMKQSQMNVPATVARLVKQVGADTTLKNAMRDGAQFAWIPHGDTCAFCITLASRGWQYMSKKALRNGHAEHIHAHCDCEYAVRFDGKSTVAGYDPDKYLEEYNNAGGDINAMRRIRYKENKDAINARKRELYAEKKYMTKIKNFNPLKSNEIVEIMRRDTTQWVNGLSDFERIAFEKYTYNSVDGKQNRFFERLNRMLRGEAEEDSKLRKYANAMSGALKRNPLRHDVICYRTMEFNPFEGMKTGDIVFPGQFLSTSIVKTGALKRNYNITICAKKGSLAGYIEPLSKFKKQRELLFDKDTLYRVISNQKNEIVLEVIL